MDKYLKYGNDKLMDSDTDVYFFNVISSNMTDLMYDIGFTPNTITFFSLLTGLFSIYYLYINEYKKASVYYFISYIFDCIDGRLARTYNMQSKHVEFLQPRK